MGDFALVCGLSRLRAIVDHRPTRKSQPELEVKLAGRTSEHKPYLHGDPRHSPRRSRSRRSRVSLSSLPVRPRGGSALARRRDEVAEERLRPTGWRPRGPAVSSTVTSELTSSTRSRSRCSAASRSSSVSASGAKRTASGPRSDVVARAVEDDDAARAGRGDEARERVDQLAPLGERPAVEEVVAVEEVEASRQATRSARAAAAPRTAAPPRRR